MVKVRRILTLIVICLLWIIVTEFSLVKPIFLPRLIEVVIALKQLLTSISGCLDILFTLKRTIIAFLIGATIAVPLGIILGSFKSIYELIEWPIDFIRSVPVTALFPLFLIFFGFEDMPKIAMAAWASGLIILVNTIHGVWNTKTDRKIMALTKRASPFQILTKITLPETFPFIFAGMRIGISWCLIVVIVTEMFIGTNHGLGHIIYDASMIFDTPTVIAGIALIGLIGFFINKLIIMLENRIVHWKSV